MRRKVQGIQLEVTIALFNEKQVHVCLVTAELKYRTTHKLIQARQN